MKIIKILITTIIVSVPTVAMALEVGFPEVGGYSPGDSAGPAEWIRYLYLLSMGLVGLALIYTFARAGIERMAGGTNPGAIESSKKRIKGGIVGLLILLGSYLFLKTINPQLVAIRNPQIENRGGQEGLFGFITSLFFSNTQREPLFTGYSKGHSCTSPTDCTEGLTCTESKCVEGKKVISGGNCTKEKSCPTGERCFERGIGTLVNENTEYEGECSPLKAIGETCDIHVAVACRGIGTSCDLATQTCVKK